MPLHEIFGDQKIAHRRHDGRQQDANGIFTLPSELGERVEAEGEIPLIDGVTKIKNTAGTSEGDEVPHEGLRDGG